MAKSENVREMIIVGIGYPASYNPNIVRVRDLIRSPDKFLDCILKELIPLIEQEYRTTLERTLWGSSYGGFFAMYALFNYADKTRGVFQNYIVASPAALETAESDGKETDLFGFEWILFVKSAELKANLYLTVGGNEEPSRFLNPFKQLVGVLDGRQYAGFFMRSFIDPGKDHYSVWEPTLYEGVRMFFKK
jgi:predicted alpha/beta superfamily hydrolase